jgi:chromosomal replication initiator protein
LCAPIKETQEVIDRDTEIVSRIRARLVTQLGEDRFELWFGNGTRLQWINEALRVSADTSFRVDRLRRGLLSEIQRVLWEECDRDVAVTFAVDTSLASLRQEEPAPASGEDVATQNGKPDTEQAAPATLDGGGVIPLVRGPRPTPGDPVGWSRRAAPSRRFARLDSLVTGPCNRMALGAVDLVVRDPGQMNPLFVHGPSGVGKSHLLEGVWSEVRRRGGRRIIYLTAEQFTTYFLQALRGSGLPSFRQKYRAVDLLILDDVQFFVGKQATITELLHTLDALLRDSGQIVMAADRSQSELAVLGAELQARISGGLVCVMQPLDLDTRRTLLRQLTQRRQLPLEDAALDRIAQRAPGDARQLIGLVNRLWATSQTLKQQLSLAMIDQVVGELFPSAGGVIKLDDIQRVVCDEFGLDPDVLRSDRRARSVSHPRMLAMWLARKHTHAALTEIGEFFGRRSHSTVLSAQNKVEGWVLSGQLVKCDKSNCDVRALLTRLERTLSAYA